jgi:DNA-binding MarR family transcriptional regulator
MEPGSGDFIDCARSDWRQAYPGLDTSALELMGRISRISAQSVQLLDRLLAASGVTRAEFGVLCALARSNRPLRASEVTAATLSSSAATTKHAARLEKAGLVGRLRLERDGRVVLLQLTEAGRSLVEAQMPRCMELDRSMLDGIGEDELAVLASLLRTISVNVEARAGR